MTNGRQRWPQFRARLVMGLADAQLLPFYRNHHLYREVENYLKGSNFTCKK